MDDAATPAMTLWFIVIQADDATALLPALLGAGIEAYAISSSGGFLRRGNVTMLAAVPAGQEAVVQAMLDDYAQTRSETRTAGLSETTARHLGDLAPAPLLLTIAGAVVFRLRVARWEQW